MSNYYYAYHSPANTYSFDVSMGYGVSSRTKYKIDKITIGDKIFVIQKKNKEPYQLCGLFEVIDKYLDPKSEKPHRLKLSDISKLDKFVNLNDESLSHELPSLNGDNRLNNFQNHFCKQGVSLQSKLPTDVVKVLLGIINFDELKSHVQDFQELVRKSKADSKEARTERLKKASKKPLRVKITTYEYKRNPDVVAEVLIRANGVCECCHKKAPFIREKDDSPYLEVHHIIPLSLDGDDTIDNAIALCPNCHRNKHYGKNLTKT